MDNTTVRAFTFRGKKLLDRLITPTKIIYNKKSIKIDAQWDTGAMGSCISHEVVKKLGLIPTGYCYIQTPSGIAKEGTYLIDVLLPNKVTVPDVMVCESEIGKQSIGLLIGMDIISLGDFAVSNFAGETAFSFAYPSMGKIGFVPILKHIEAAATKDKEQ